MRQALNPSDGREVEVFRREDPRVLPGAHAALMTSALASETTRYLLYAPIYDAYGGPFGLRSRPASHAVAVTATRLLISENPHQEGSDPLIWSLPLERILVLGTGCALLQGWLSIRYFAEGEMAQVTFFYSSTGSHHAAALVRECRAIWGRKVQIRQGESAISWSEVWGTTQPSLAAETRPLVAEGEYPLAVVSAFAGMSGSAGRAGKRPRRKAGPAVIVATSHGLIVAEEETPLRPGIMAFGVNVSVFPPDAIREVILDRPDGKANGEQALRIIVRSTSEEIRTGLSVPESSRTAAERLREIYAGRGR